MNIRFTTSFSIFITVIILCLLVLIGPASAPAYAQTPDAENMELVGHIGGQINTVFVQGNYAYIGEGPRLTILDISNPASPIVVGKTALFSDIVQGVFVSGSYSYVTAGYGGLWVVDVSNPTSPVEVGYYDTPGSARDVYVVGSHAYVAEYSSGLRVVDVSNPASPVAVGFYDTPGSADGVYVVGSYAYLADGYSGLQVIDISNPANPVEVGFLSESAYDVYVVGSYAYVTDGYGGGLKVVDVSNPASPVEVGFLPGSAYDVYVVGSYAYVTDGYGGGLKVVDVSNPTNPAAVGFYATSGFTYGTYDIHVAGNYAYVADYDSGLWVMDISNPASPVEVGYYDTPDFARDVQIVGNYAYVADEDLLVVDVSNPATPVQVGAYDATGFGASDVYVVDNIAYVACGNSGLKVVDISNPTSPVAMGQLSIEAYDVHVVGSYAYVTSGFYRGLQVVDVSNPVSPVKVGDYDSPGYARGVYIAGSYAYVADDTGGLRVVDISNPASPLAVGHYDTPGSAYGVYVAGSTAYVADGTGGLRVVDVSNPVSPVEVGFLPVEAFNVYVMDGYAYTTAGSDGLRVVDVSNPASPAAVGFYHTPGAAGGVYVAGSYAYMAAGNSGLRVVDVSHPVSPAAVGHYDIPNSIGDVYVMGSTAYTTVEYDGLRVVDISNPASPVGVGFYDTPDFASGVYVAGSYAYVADGSDGGLRVIDISNPASPVEVGYYNTSGFAGDVYVTGSTAYVADNSKGLRVVDVSNPAAPTEVGYYDTPGSARNVYVAGSYAYVADYSSGLRVVDVSNPTSPVEVGYNMSGRADDVCVVGSYAYVADGSDGGLRVMDVSNPVSPVEMGYYDMPESAYGVAVSGTYAYVADDDGGLRVVDVSNPAAPTEVGFYDTPGSAGDVYVSGSYAYVADHDGGLLILRYTGNDPDPISGYITDQNGTPTSGVLVDAGIGGTTTTDANGYFEFSGLPAGVFTLRPSKAGYSFSPERRGVSILPSATTDQSLFGMDGIGASSQSQDFSSDADGGPVEPFLYLPISYGPEERKEDFLALLLDDWETDEMTNKKGRISSWFDHANTNDYFANPGRIMTYDGRLRNTGLYYAGDYRCYESRCYQGHNGIDFNSQGEDLTIKAAAGGEVVFAAWQQNTTYGNTVIIDHKNGYYTRYSHLAEIYAGVPQPVNTGDPVGKMGNTGGDFGVHLHFGLYRGGWTEAHAVDPYGWAPSAVTIGPVLPDFWHTEKGGPVSKYLWKYSPITPFTVPPDQPFDKLDQTGTIRVEGQPNTVSGTATYELARSPVAAPSTTLKRTTGKSFWVQLTEWVDSLFGSGMLDEVMAAESLLPQLTKPIKFTVNYANGDVHHLDESQLAIHRWNADTQSWAVLSTTVDTVNNVVTAESIELGEFDLQAPLICPADDAEPFNDSTHRPTSLTSRTTISTLFDISDDEDWYSLEATAGVTYTIQTSNLAANVDTILQLYDSDSVTQITEDDDGGDGSASRLEWQAPANGTYYIRVSMSPDSTFGCEANYDISIAREGEGQIYLPIIIK